MACSLPHWVQRGELKLDVEDSTRLLMIEAIDMNSVVLKDRNKKKLHLKNLSGESNSMSAIISETESKYSIVRLCW